MELKTPPMYHLTVKWPTALPGQPEVMVNAYVPSAGDLATAFEDIASIAAESYGLPRPRNPFEVAKEEATAGQQPTPIRQASRPAVQPAPEPPAYDDLPFEDEAEQRSGGTLCPKHGTPMAPSKYEGLFCKADDPAEDTGRCRWVDDSRGVRRKPPKGDGAALRASGR